VLYTRLAQIPSFPFNSNRFFRSLKAGEPNTGEVLRAASQITPGDFESYYNEFYFLGTQLHNISASIDSKKNPISVRDTLFRSAAYYRSSVFFLIGNQSDPRLYSVWDQATADFDKALSLMTIPGVRHNISAPNVRKNFTTPIIFYKASNDNKKRPTVIFCNGYDGPQEDGLHSLGQYVLERGWNFVSYEGPGQNTVRRQQNIGFIPNWWDVVTAVVDYLSGRPDVDMSKVVLVGVSFGAILAPRTAMREHRFAAVVAIDGSYSVRDSFFDQANAPQLEALYNSGNRTAFDAIMNALRLNTSSPATTRWTIDQGLWCMDTSSPFDWLTNIGQINITETNAKEITVPIFVGSGQNDSSFPGQAPIAAKWYGDKTYLYNFTNDLGAGQHCQIGAEDLLNAISLDWLAGIFSGAKISANGTIIGN
jgi:pimeloyl-ACP methyl ester carboxylesterase